MAAMITAAVMIIAAAITAVAILPEKTADMKTVQLQRKNSTGKLNNIAKEDHPSERMVLFR